MTRDVLATLNSDIYALQPQFNAVAVDRGVNFEREASFALQILAANDYLAGIAINNRQSLADAITNVAALGISLNPASKQAYLVPRNKRVCLDISYQGMMDLALASGSILWVQCNVVRERDNLILHGIDKAPEHIYQPFGERGEIVGVYVVAKTREGDYLTHTMTIDDVHNIRDRSESWKAYQRDKSKKNPWVTDAVEMIRKTCVKQASKYWPDVPRLEAAVHYLNTDGGEGIELGGGAVMGDDFQATPLELLGRAEAAAGKGLKAYQVFFSGITKDERKALSPHHEELKAAAAKADERNTVDVPAKEVDDDFVRDMNAEEGRRD